MDSQPRFRLAEWTVEPSSNSISNNRHTMHVEPKVMQVLVCLATNGGEVVARDALVRSVWRDTFVSDDVLKRAISELRKALGDDAREPRFVQTVPKSGYRLLCHPC